MLKFNLVTFLLLLTGCCTLIEAGQAFISLGNASLPSTINQDKPIVADDIEKKTSSTSTSSTSTTTSSTTSTSTTTTTTKAPETSTTTTTSSTTKAPDTTTKAPNTTTIAPITTTAAPPKPYPEPKIGTWNSSCIMIKMAAQLNFTYETKDNKTSTALYNLPTEAVVDDAHCEGNTTQTMQINWGPKDAQSTMLVQFELKNKTAQMTMLRFVLALTGGDFPNAKDKEILQLIHRGFDFSAPSKMSYHCTRSQKLNFTETIQEKEIIIGTVTVRDVQLEAFRPINSTSFSTVHDCDSSETSDIVPIAVGIALAALITIVLVAYLCARRRSTSRGYVSF